MNNHIDAVEHFNPKLAEEWLAWECHGILAEPIAGPDSANHQWRGQNNE
jgi:hypothetical protein